MRKLISTICIPPRLSQPSLESLTPVYTCEPKTLNVFLKLQEAHMEIITSLVNDYDIEDVIDVGCGSGWHALQLHQRFQALGLRHVRVYGIDSDNKTHFSPDAKLPFVNTLDATTLHSLSSKTLCLSIWPFAQYFTDQPYPPVDAWAANLEQNRSGIVTTVCPFGTTNMGALYPIQPHWIHTVIENNPQMRMLHIGDMNDRTVATQGLFRDYIVDTYDVPNTTVYLLEYKNVATNKRMKIEFSTGNRY